MTPSQERTLAMRDAHSRALVDSLMGRGYRTNFAAHLRAAWAMVKRQRGVDVSRPEPVRIVSKPLPESIPARTPAQEEAFLLTQKTKWTAADERRFEDLRNR